MLNLDADVRITAEQALAHPYLAQYADPSDEPVADKQYDDSFENLDHEIPEWRRLVYNEVINFVPHLDQQRHGFEPDMQQQQQQMPPQQIQQHM